MKKFLIPIAVVLVIVAAATSGGSSRKKSTPKQPIQERVETQSGATTTLVAGAPVISVGFERETVVASARAFFDEIKTTLPSGQTVTLPIQYEGGAATDRYARIVPDPTQTGNQVLQFWMKNAKVSGARAGYYKGRIQMHLSGIGEPSAHARFRMYLPPDMEHYRAYPKENHWFTISELWSRPSDGKHFRITISIVKEAGAGAPLRFTVSGDERTGGTPGNETWKSIWGSANTQFEVPVGEWLDMEIGYKQGDNTTGRLYLSAKREGDAHPATIFDITNWTYNPKASKPSPLTDWDVLKLYTSGEIIDYIRNQGGVAQIYWDDLEISKDWSR